MQELLQPHQEKKNLKESSKLEVTKVKNPVGVSAGQESPDTGDSEIYS